ncbi:MAG: phage tail protein [Chloroflexota bacterium]|nr:phage tail protein [Chloroflexota bacterium]
MADEHKSLIDSLSANEFAVEIEGQRANAILNVTGLITFKLDVKPSLTKLERPTFKIGKLVQHDAAQPFNVWIRESTGARDDIVRPQRTLAIVALDEGIETRRWTIKGAWISEIAYSKFDTGSSELIEETLTIQYAQIDELWPATMLTSGE